jgi:hypothetical protein
MCAAIVRQGSPTAPPAIEAGSQSGLRFAVISPLNFLEGVTVIMMDLDWCAMSMNSTIKRFVHRPGLPARTQTRFEFSLQFQFGHLTVHHSLQVF